MTMERRWTIYTLTHPETMEVRYVGITHQGLVQRLREHLSKARRNVEHNHRACWIRSLLAVGLRPVITPLESGSGDAWAAAEQRWILQFANAGASLVNATAGGEGTLGYAPSEKARAKISEAMRKRSGEKRSPEARQRMRDAQRQRVEREKAAGFVRVRPPRSAETRQRMAAAQRGKKASAETRQKLSEIRKNPSPEARDRLRQAVLDRPLAQRQAFAKANQGRKFSDEHRRRMSEGRKQAWARKKGGCDNR